jgi:hypothetical protein
MDRFFEEVDLLDFIMAQCRKQAESPWLPLWVSEEAEKIFRLRFRLGLKEIGRAYRSWRKGERRKERAAAKVARAEAKAARKAANQARKGKPSAPRPALVQAAAALPVPAVTPGPAAPAPPEARAGSVVVISDPAPAVAGTAGETAGTHGQ